MTDSQETPTLHLPDGWERNTKVTHLYLESGQVWVSLAGHMLAAGMVIDMSEVQDDSDFARLVEAAGIVEQLRAGAR